MDETAFCLDPKKSQTITPKGSKAYKIRLYTQGRGIENVTIVGVVNESGKVLDPVIIYQGRNFQQSWRGVIALYWIMSPPGSLMSPGSQSPDWSRHIYISHAHVNLLLYHYY